MSATRPSELHDLFERYANDGEVDALAGLYEGTAILVGPTGDEYVGRAAIRSLLADMLSGAPQFGLTTRYARQCGDLALMSNAWRMTLVSDGHELLASGASAELARRQADGRWLYVIDDPFRDS